MTDAPQSLGGVARAAALTPKQRSLIAKAAALTRWGKAAEPKLRAVLTAYRRLERCVAELEQAMAELRRL